MKTFNRRPTKADIIYRPFILTEKDKQLLSEFDYGIITADVFLKNFSVDIKSNSDFVRKEITNAIETGEPDEIQVTKE